VQRECAQDACAHVSGGSRDNDPHVRALPSGKCRETSLVGSGDRLHLRYGPA
jgi:hypothetical protein